MWGRQDRYKYTWFTGEETEAQNGSGRQQVVEPGLEAMSSQACPLDSFLPTFTPRHGHTTQSTQVWWPSLSSPPYLKLLNLTAHPPFTHKKLPKALSGRSLSSSLPQSPQLIPHKGDYLFPKTFLGLSVPCLMRNPSGSQACPHKARHWVLTIWQWLILENPGEDLLWSEPVQPTPRGPGGCRKPVDITGLQHPRISTEVPWPHWPQLLCQRLRWGGVLPLSSAHRPIQPCWASCQWIGMLLAHLIRRTKEQKRPPFRIHQTASQSRHLQSYLPTLKPQQVFTNSSFSLFTPHFLHVTNMLSKSWWQENEKWGW